MAPATDYDVLVIGGGPGGSCAAAYARKHDYRTLVVEKAAFPRFKIGESLLPTCNAILRETGAWSKVEAAGFFPKYGATFYLSNGCGTKNVDFRNSAVAGLDSTYQVDRAKFDEILLEHSQSLGAEVRQQTTVRGIKTENGIHGVTLEDSSGLRTVTARWVLDASGRENFFLTEQKRAFDPPVSPKRVAIYSHFRGIARPAGRDEGNTVVVRLEDGWFWLIPLDAERTSVGLVTTLDAMKSSNLSPEALFHREVANSAKLRELFTHAEGVMGFHVTSDYTYFRRELAQEKLLLIGDAAGFFDPIFSSGAYMSMWSAKRAVELMVRADAASRGLSTSEREGYTRELKAHAGVFRKLIDMFYNNESFAVFMCEPVPWNLTPGITSIVAGHAKLTWPLWWRFKIFLLVCRLQQRWALVPRLDYRQPEAMATT